MKGKIMKKFRDYLIEREQAAPSDSMVSNGLGDISTPESEDDVLMRIAKIAVDDHRTDAMSFFQHLAGKDKRIEEELKELHHSKKHGFRPKDRKLPGQEVDDRDEVVPSSADGQGGLEGSEGE
jgi:hypothetical protein